MPDALELALLASDLPSPNRISPTPRFTCSSRADERFFRLTNGPTTVAASCGTHTNAWRGTVVIWHIPVNILAQVQLSCAMQRRR